MFPGNFGYVRARSVENALELLAKYGENAKLLAGGHSLIPAMKLRLAAPEYLIDLAAVPDLRGVRIDGDFLTIGALTVHAEIAASQAVRQHLPGLAEAAAVIGDVQVRNRGTIGGSIAHNDPGADFPVMLTALDAAFVLVSPAGTRTVSAEDFFVDFFTTALAPNEVITEVRVPLPPAGSGTAYAKLPHPASGYVVVSAGALITQQSSGVCAAARIAVGGLGGGPQRALATEAGLRGQRLSPETVAAAAGKAADGADPADDPYASADYKHHVATVYTRKAIEAAMRRITGQVRAPDRGS